MGSFRLYFPVRWNDAILKCETRTLIFAGNGDFIPTYRLTCISRRVHGLRYRAPMLRCERVSLLVHSPHVETPRFLAPSLHLRFQGDSHGPVQPERV